jgi:hypothetical protein
MAIARLPTAEKPRTYPKITYTGIIVRVPVDERKPPGSRSPYARIESNADYAAYVKRFGEVPISVPKDPEE